MINIYTDGACKDNPGEGGWSAIISQDGNDRELSGGYELTTSNRMELMSVIRGLESIKKGEEVTIFSDSKYVVNAFNRGWISNWLKNGWKTSSKENVKNSDLWKHLLFYCDIFNPTFKWVKGHDGNKLNERCDVLANEAIEELELIEDEGYIQRDENPD